MIGFPRLSFVDKPDESARVRLDLNTLGEIADDETWPGRDGFSLGSPSFEGEPGAISAQYGYRQVTFGLLVAGSKMNAAATLSKLARELLRDGGNWLRFQLSEGSAPMWLRTWQTSPGELSYERVMDLADDSEDVWGIEVALDADPFIYGARETLPVITINNDIAAGANPLLAVLPTIKGDAPTPLRIECSAPPAGKGQLIGMVSVDSADAAGYTSPFRIESGWSLMSGTTAVSGSGFSGGSGYRIAFSGTTSMSTVMYDTTADFVGGGTSPRVKGGRFRAFARVGWGAVTATFQIRLGQKGSSGLVIYNSDAATVSATGTAAWQWVDLGEIALPFGNHLTPELADTHGVGPTDLTIQAARPSGTGSLDFDHLMLVPVHLTASEGSSARLAKVERGTGVNGAGSLVQYDAEGDDKVVLITDVGNSLDGLAHMAEPAVIQGSLPWAVPGKANLLHLLRSMTGDVITDTTTLTISYQPRWLWLAAI